MYEEKIIWHEITKRPPTKEEDEEFERIWGEACAYVFDCEMPEDGQEILVATKWGVDTDICSVCNGIDLEGKDIEDVLAWAAMPKYKGGETDG